MSGCGSPFAVGNEEEEVEAPADPRAVETQAGDLARAAFAAGHGQDYVRALLGETFRELDEVTRRRVLERVRVSAAPAAPTEAAGSAADPEPAGTTFETLRSVQVADMPARTWFADGMVCPGFNVVSAKKAMGKSFLLLQAADAIAKGEPFLGRPTTKGKVLYVSFELDALDLHERLKGREPLSEDVAVAYSWPSGEKGLAAAEKAITEHGFKVVIFDTFLPLIPTDGQFDINGYGDSTFYLKWRLMAKKHGAAIIASWHEGKAPREDFMLSAIGSTGMIGQADCVVSIDRKRGDAQGKLYLGGNHAPETAISFLFENGMFKLAEGQAAVEHLSRDEEKTLSVLKGHPDGATTVQVAVETGKSDASARQALGRLVARGKITRLRPGFYTSGQVILPDCDSVTKRDKALHVTPCSVTDCDTPLKGVSQCHGATTSRDAVTEEKKSPAIPLLEIF